LKIDYLEEGRRTGKGKLKVNVGETGDVD